MLSRTQYSLVAKYGQKLSRGCIVAAGIYLILLPRPELTREAYISENALMPDYAVGHYDSEFRKEFSKIGKELTITDGAAGEVEKLKSIISAHLEEITGKRSGPRQSERQQVLEATLQAERGDGTESLLLLAPYLTLSGSINKCGIAFVLATAKQYKKFKFWARDFILLFPGLGSESRQGVLDDVESWLATFHETALQGTTAQAHLPDRGTAIQAGISVEFEGINCDGAFADPEVYIEGPNGLLPNLDLINTMVMTERHRAGKLEVMPKNCSWYSLWRSAGKVSKYLQSLVHVTAMMARQAFGYPVFAHGPLLKYRIDSVSLAFHQIDTEQASDAADRNMFELVELTFRSLSNILEHLHQSFFFYILCDNETFVSIANYIAIGILPIAALTIASFVDGAKTVQNGRGIIQEAPMFVFGMLAALNVGALLLVQGASGSHIKLVQISGLLIPIVVALFTLLKLRITKPQWLCCLWAALAITPLLFLNFGLAVLSGIVYGISLIFDMKHPFLKLMQLLTMPSVMLAILLLVGNEYASYLARNLAIWNWGIPFFLLQPPLLIAFCCTGSEEPDSQAKGHPKNE